MREGRGMEGGGGGEAEGKKKMAEESVEGNGG